MSSERRFHLGIACPLPPAATGPATYLAGMLPALASLADVTCFVPNPADVDPALRETWRVRDLDDRHAADVDIMAYHLANNPLHREVLHAALEGPAGLVVLHDASLHHLLVDEFIARGDLDGFEAWLTEAHGERGAAIASARLYGGTEIEQFVFDGLKPVLDLHLAVQVHSRYAAAIVERRCPGMPVSVVPLYAPTPATVRESWKELKRSNGDRRVTIANFGFITKPKCYEEICEAIRLLLDVGAPIEFVFVGQDQTFGDLRRTIERLDIGDAVRVTGWVDDAQLDQYIASADIAVSLRRPTVGESSFTLATLQGAGVPVVVETVGSWAEAPPGTVVHMQGEGPVALADALLDLVSSEVRRRDVGAAARAYASSRLDVRLCASLVLDAARAASAIAVDHTPAAIVHGRRASVRAFQRNAVGVDVEVSALLTDIPPARPQSRLLAIGIAEPVAVALQQVWGYEVVRVPGPRVGRLPVAPGSADVVLCAHATSARVLKEIARALRPGGAAHFVGEGAGRPAFGDLLGDAGLSTASSRSERNDRLSVVANKCGIGR